MKAVGSSETSLHIYQNIWHQIPEEKMMDELDYFKGLLHQFLRGTEEIHETLIWSSQSPGLQDWHLGPSSMKQNSNHHAETCSTSSVSKSNKIAGYYYCISLDAFMVNKLCAWR
jgi:hypothetical protein